MTISEYSIRMLAFNLSEIDKTQRIATQAFMNNLASGVDKNGKPVIQEIKDLFNYEEEVKKVYHPQKREEYMNQDLVHRAKRLQEYHKRKEDKLK